MSVTQTIVELLVALIGASVLLDVIYRIYTKIAGTREAEVETKNSAKVAQDEVTDAKDKTQADADENSFNSSVDKFNGDTK